MCYTAVESVAGSRHLQTHTHTGLGISALDSVFKAIILNKILYALTVYFGYLTEGQRHML